MPRATCLSHAGNKDEELRPSSTSYVFRCVTQRCCKQTRDDIFQFLSFQSSSSRGGNYLHQTGRHIFLPALLVSVFFFLQVSVRCSPCYGWKGVLMLFCFCVHSARLKKVRVLHICLKEKKENGKKETLQWLWALVRKFTYTFIRLYAVVQLLFKGRFITSNTAHAQLNAFFLYALLSIEAMALMQTEYKKRHCWLTLTRWAGTHLNSNFRPDDGAPNDERYNPVGICCGVLRAGWVCMKLEWYFPLPVKRHFASGAAKSGRVSWWCKAWMCCCWC